MDQKELHDIIINLPEGYSEAIVNEKKYGISKQSFNDGKSFKVYAEELGGNDFISFNYYLTSTPVLKPCEMPEAKVNDFLASLQSD